jgi:hypothetical protein
MRLQKPIYIRDGDIPLYIKTATLAQVVSWGEQDAALTPRMLRLDP